MRGHCCAIPAQMHDVLFTSPFVRYYTGALDAALAHPDHWLPAFIPDVTNDVEQRDYLRVYRHNGLATYSNPNLAGKQTSMLRIISCLHADGVGYFAALHEMLHHAGCSSERSQADDALSLDTEAFKRAGDLRKLIERAVSGAVEVRRLIRQHCLHAMQDVRASRQHDQVSPAGWHFIPL